MEAVNAHCGNTTETRTYYQRREARYGNTPGASAEYYAAARDLASYAQSFARYWMVRDGLFAFEPATSTTDDYLRVQLDPARDLRTLRSPNALMASEGFVASVFFHMMASDCDGLDGLANRYRALFEALRSAEREKGDLDHVPLIDVIGTLAGVDAAMAKRAMRAFLDLSRGVTVDIDAQALWSRFFDAALHVEIAERKRVMSEIEARRRQWERQTEADPRFLARRIGPIVVLESPSVRVGIALFGSLYPLAFDINAAGAAMLRLVPGLTGEQISKILAMRDKETVSGCG